MSTYQEAHDCFEENSTIIGAPVQGVTSDEDMIAWNLNAGLLNLTLALQNDIVTFRNALEYALEDIRHRLTRIDQALQR